MVKYSTISQTSPLEDVQNRKDERHTAIDRVGISHLRYPVTVIDHKGGHHQTHAEFEIAVNLAQESKGTHMSRFIEVLNRHKDHISASSVHDILLDLKNTLESDNAFITMAFPYFVEKVSPVSGMKSMMDFQCRLSGELKEDTSTVTIGVVVPVTSLCPCSKEISDYGAHNQRGYVSIEVGTVRGTNGQHKPLWVEELIEIAEESASSPLYPLLKRSDERHVTMQAYDNPVFVEDLIRNVAVQLKADGRINRFSIHVENQESIHNHNAFAQIAWERK